VNSSILATTFSALQSNFTPLHHHNNSLWRHSTGAQLATESIVRISVPDASREWIPRSIGPINVLSTWHVLVQGPRSHGVQGVRWPPLFRVRGLHAAFDPLFVSYSDFDFPLFVTLRRLCLSPLLGVWPCEG